MKASKNTTGTVINEQTNLDLRIQFKFFLFKVYLLVLRFIQDLLVLEIRLKALM